MPDSPDPIEIAAEALLNQDNPHLGHQFPRDKVLAKWAATTALTASGLLAVQEERDRLHNERGEAKIATESARFVKQGSMERWDLTPERVHELLAAAFGVTTAPIDEFARWDSPARKALLRLAEAVRPLTKHCGYCGASALREQMTWHEPDCDSPALVPQGETDG